MTSSADAACSPAAPLPLADLLVLDLTIARAGPTAVRQLADWGARVIRIEPHSPETALEDHLSPDYLNLHRNKQSLSLDLKRAEGVAVLHHLVGHADVLVENLRPPVKARLGFDWPTPHEVFAKEFLRPNGELTQVLESQWNISGDEVLDVLVARSNSPSSRLRRSILSGPVDIDKMDYLARDSQHCGVPYGRHFDRNRLINSLIVNEAGDGLAITSKGRTAAEMMVFARYVMFTEVYWHHAVRSATTMFARSFLELLPKLDLNSLFRMSEPDLVRCLCSAARGTDVASLTDGLFGQRRRLHKRLAEYSIYHQESLYHALRQMTATQLAACSSMLTEKLAAVIGRQLSPMDVLIDAPPQHREVEFRVDVWFRSSQEYRALRDVSPIVDAMAKTQFDECVKRVRIFVAAEPRDLIPAGLSVDDLVMDVLRHPFITP